MPLETLILIALAVAGLVILGFLLASLVRAGAEAKKLKDRIDALATLPIITRAAAAPLDIARIQAALEAAPPLVERAQAAFAALRQTSLVPAAIVGAVRTVRAEAVAFRRALRG